MFSKTRRGFTLIELLIVIVVIAILALIVIPRVMNASDRARHASYDANKQIIRNAIEQFRTDTGVYPKVLADLYATAAPTAANEGTGYVAAGWHGPYLTVKDNNVSDTVLLPANPYVARDKDATNEAGHWDYDVIATAVNGKTNQDYTLYSPGTPADDKAPSGS